MDIIGIGYWCQTEYYIGKKTTSLPVSDIYITEVVIIGNINSQVATSIHIPYKNGNKSYICQTSLKYRTGYMHSSSSSNTQGGFIEFEITSDYQIKLTSAYLNSVECSSNTNWKVFYKYINI